MSNKNKVIRPFNKELIDKFIKNSNKELDIYKTDIEKYQKSFNDIIEFSKKISAIQKKSINCIIFHTENSDGVMSANIALKYLLEQKKI